MITTHKNSTSQRISVEDQGVRITNITQSYQRVRSNIELTDTTIHVSQVHSADIIHAVTSNRNVVQHGRIESEFTTVIRGEATISDVEHFQFRSRDVESVCIEHGKRLEAKLTQFSETRNIHCLKRLITLSTESKRLHVRWDIADGRIKGLISNNAYNRRLGTGRLSGRRKSSRRTGGRRLSSRRLSSRRKGSRRKSGRRQSSGRKSGRRKSSRRLSSRRLSSRRKSSRRLSSGRKGSRRKSSR